MHVRMAGDINIDAVPQSVPIPGMPSGSLLSDRSVSSVRAWVSMHSLLAIILGVVSAVWTSSSSYPSWCDRIMFITTLSFLGVASMATVFPSERIPPSGARIYLPLLCCHGLSTSFVVCHNLFNSTSNVNSACRAIHVLLALAVMCNGFQSIVRPWLLSAHRWGWRSVRATMAADGLAFLAATLALRSLGPPAAYPPGQVGFRAAMGRGATTLVLALGATPANRHRTKALVLKAAAWLDSAGASTHIESDIASVALVLDNMKAVPVTAPGAQHHAPAPSRMWVDALSMGFLCRQKLARRFTCMRLILLVLALLGPLLNALFTGWLFLFSTRPNDSRVFLYFYSSLPNDSRVYLYFVSVYPYNLMIAARFPDHTVPEGKVLFIGIVGSIIRCVGVLLDLFHTGALVNASCTLVHRLASVVIFCAWLHAGVLGYADRFSWANARCVHCIEGAAFLLSTMLIRALGPSERYPPGSMSFGCALARGCLPLLLGGVILSRRNRLRVATLANRLGIYHVTVSLGELRPAPDVQLVLDADIIEFEATSVSASVPSGSHHTARLDNHCSFVLDNSQSTLQSIHATIRPPEVGSMRSRCARSEPVGRSRF